MSAPEQPNLLAKGQFLVYQAEDGQVKIDVRLHGETAWLTQAHMAELFQTTVPNISMHLRNIYAEGELQPAATIQDFLTVRQEGVRQVSRSVEHYNLDAIISVGYRVKSAVATRFRIWATQQLREFIVKGFVLDDERLKNPDRPFDYFDELLRRIQDIRTSERPFYQKITDIYATSIDYDPTQPESIEFFQTVQNKMHWAITGQTAAEIIHARASAAKPHMGLTSWRGAKVRKEDVIIAKNYLSEPELAALNNLVEQYLVFAEGQAMRRVPMPMRDWITKLHAFLTINDRHILIPKGWEVKRIGEVADTFRGRSYRSVDLAEEGGLPFLNLKCLDRDGGFRRSGLKRYTGEYKAGFVEPTLEQMDTLENKTDKLRRTRDLLLPRLLSGQVELKIEEVQARALRKTCSRETPHNWRASTLIRRFQR